MAYDPADGYVLLFGGFNSNTLTYMSDTWEFQGGKWTELHPAAHPESRGAATMAYDGADGYMVLFGGCGASSCPFGDTWTYRAGIWTELHPTLSPTPSTSTIMTYDGRDGYILLFGGDTGLSDLSSTWTFRGGQWSELTPSVHPPARSSGFISNDRKDGYVVLFGGSDPYLGRDGTNLADTWKFIGGKWTELHPGNHPAARNSGSMSYDAADGYVLLFGGATQGSSGALSNTWKFLGGEWKQLAPSIHPSPRTLQGMTFDSHDDFIFLFGGYNGNYLADWWSYSHGVWVELGS